MEIELEARSNAQHRNSTGHFVEKTFLDVRFHCLQHQDVVDLLIVGQHRKDFAYVVTPNVDHMLRIHADEATAQAYSNAWLCVNDSRILAGLATAAGATLPVTPGSDLIAGLLADPRLGRDTPMLIVGGPAGLLGDLQRLFGFTRLAQHRPPMGLLRNPAAVAEVIDVVEASAARFVILAVGSPQQEFLAAMLRKRGRAGGVGLCVGAGLDFLVGTQKRAPVWMRQVGLEWAFRLGSDPGRLWRRYLLDGPRIFGIYLAWLLRDAEPTRNPA